MNAVARQHELNVGKNGIPDERVAARGAVGKTTQVQALEGGAAGTARPPLFSGAESWEPIDPVDDQLAHLEAGDGADAEGGAEHGADPAAVGEAARKSEAAPAAGASPASLVSLPERTPAEQQDAEDAHDGGDAHEAGDAHEGEGTHEDAAEHETDPAHGAALAQASLAPAVQAKAAADPKPKQKQQKKQKRDPLAKFTLPPNTPAHGKKYERLLKRPKKKHLTAKMDKYNVRDIKSNTSDPKRPGPQKKYTINPTPDPDPEKQKAPRERYRIVNGDQAERVDVVAVGQEVALNASETTLLKVGNTTERCVLVWASVQGSAWIPISSLADNAQEATEIQRSVDKLAKKWSPAVASTSGTRRFKFRPLGDKIATPDDYDKTNYILGHQSGTGNNVEDYLQRFAPDGVGGERHYYNICMNLPQNDAPPVAIDIANPGEVFFVKKGRNFQREISIFNKSARATVQLQKWVYGFIGKQVGNKWVPDPTRVGWVPLRVLVRWAH